MGNADTSSILSRALHQHPILLQIVRDLVCWIAQASFLVLLVVFRDPSHAEHFCDGVQDAVFCLLALHGSNCFCEFLREDDVEELGDGETIHG